MNFKDITVGIVTFNSEKVIFECLKSIKRIKKIIIFDNSNDQKLKKKISLKYPKIKFVLSKKNIGYGSGNNKIINLCETKYLFILNPDTVLKKNCEDQLLKTLNQNIKDLSILAPISNDINYGFFDEFKNSNTKNNFKVDYVKGFAMLVDIKKIKNIGKFDENFFLYLEEIDLCKRLAEKGYSVYINQIAKINHLAAKSSNLGLEFEKCRNWHWMWSNFYFYKKYNSYSASLLKFFPQLLFLSLKIIINLISINKKKLIKNLFRISGLLNAMIGKSSWYRPKIN
jgi:N-acetylglucosaminyl-diphospho-decaprenol L-rhamnosyltransferase